MTTENQSGGGSSYQVDCDGNNRQPSMSPAQLGHAIVIINNTGGREVSCDKLNQATGRCEILDQFGPRYANYHPLCFRRNQ